MQKKVVINPDLSYYLLQKKYKLQILATDAGERKLYQKMLVNSPFKNFFKDYDPF